jgi:RNA polymerase sigma-70 factor, ECF subfamily
MTHMDVEKSITIKRTAFQKIAKEHEPALVRTSVRLCRTDSATAEDLVQETLIRAYKAYIAGMYDDAATPGPWLNRILTNLFINQYRRRVKWDSGADLDDLTQRGLLPNEALHAAPSDMPGVRLLELTLDEDLQKALEMLSEDMRQTIMLVDVEGLEYEEAAQQIGCPIGTVRSRLARARMKMHDLLQDFAKKRGLER